MRLSWFLLDTSVVNAYILQCESPNHRPTRPISKKKKAVFQTQLDFAIELGQLLVETHTSRKRVGRPLVVPVSDARVTCHVPCQYKSPWQCVVCGPKVRKRVKYGCAHCGVALCIVPCFGMYHR